MEVYDLIIIGGGCAGFSAAIYSARYSLRTLVISREIGGALNEAHVVENYPGFKSISGLELMMRFKEHAESLGVEFIEDEVIKAEKKGDVFLVQTRKKSYEAKAIILALGLQRRKLNIPGEDKFIGKGVSYCYTCDAAFFKDKIVGVVGGSDSAAMAALLLSRYSKKVYIIYRKQEIRAAPINKKAVEENKKIEIIPNTNIIELKGDKFLTSVVFDKPYKGSKEFKLDGLFVEIGHIPSTIIAENLGVKLNDEGFIIVDKEKRTNIGGVFAAGDITDTVLRQAVTAASDGAVAAYSAYKYLEKLKHKK